MGINFELQHEDGELIEVGDILLGDDLPRADDLSYPYLRLIDPYGDTTFGAVQMLAVLPELDRWSKVRPSKAVLKLLELAQKCASRAHAYLKLIGD
jgi:hypothetical protein